MSAPNIVDISTLYGKTAVQIVAASATAILSNAGGSGKVLKVKALYVANVDGTSNYSLTVDIYRSSVAYRIAYLVVVPAAASLDVLTTPIYLEEGDELRLTGSTVNKLEAVCSYEEIS